ncbi:dehydrogenase/reductase SDR family member 12-like isoform X2 [Mytilus galloprovincialis]|uniref:dehydrogenase/reductase SDR family member 12-like isoform X1 n=2 Tax=Mytilus galloprovincialis TaxID=29158 RepID=UPI003F7C6D7F
MAARTTRRSVKKEIMSIYRSTVWFVKGLKEYTKQGYLNASRSFRPNDLDVDVTGKSFMITGANSGIGKCSALAIAKKGGIVHMVCRDSIRGEDARKEITDTTGNQNVFLHLLDMSKPKDIAKFAADFETSGKNLDVLINNAGCMVIVRELTDDGLEKNFATNTLGAHVLTTSLLSVLNKAEKPRVILVTSGGMLVQKLDLKDLQFEKMYPFDGTMAYAQNKRQQVIMTEQYAKNYPNIHCSCMHPGWADTPAVRMSMPSFHAKMKDRLRTPEQGADTLLWLAISDAALQQPSGLFFQDRTSVSKHLPLAWSKSTKQEDEQLMSALNDLSKQYSTLS